MKGKLCKWGSFFVFIASPVSSSLFLSSRWLSTSVSVFTPKFIFAQRRKRREEEKKWYWLTNGPDWVTVNSEGEGGDVGLRIPGGLEQYLYANLIATTLLLVGVVDLQFSFCQSTPMGSFSRQTSFIELWWTVKNVCSRIFFIFESFARFEMILRDKKAKYSIRSYRLGEVQNGANTFNEMQTDSKRTQISTKIDTKETRKRSTIAMSPIHASFLRIALMRRIPIWEKINSNFFTVSVSRDQLHSIWLVDVICWFDCDGRVIPAVMYVCVSVLLLNFLARTIVPKSSCR